MAASSVDTQELLKYVPFSSCISPSFWFELNRVKLEEYKLNDDLKNLNGFFNNCSSNDLPPIMNFDYSSFQIDTAVPTNTNVRTSTVNGQLRVLNTINEFNVLDKNSLLDQLGQSIWSDIKSGRAVDDPSLLIKFCLITFANLKSYIFHYWFAFPAITFPNKSFYLRKFSKYSDRFDSAQGARLVENLNAFQLRQLRPHSFFGIDTRTQTVLSVREAIDAYNAAASTGAQGDDAAAAATEADSGTSLQPTHILFAFYDPNSQSNYPGWSLRNYLALLSLKCRRHAGSKKQLEVLSFRDRFSSGTRSIDHSLIFDVEMLELTDEERVSTIGWERNEKNQLHPRIVDMSSSMNTEKLAESAVNLNLKLMKWRIAPDVNLDIVKSQRCLLLGSGTLGCNVARCLMAWGVETITFVDNSKVSYSNPVRQSLFVFQDSIGGGQNDNQKSLTAAHNLKQIYPGVNAKGIVLSIPMPGHSVPENMRSKVKDDVAKLEELISEHDCIFLLMDTRESRWLPTVIAAAKKKLVINSALGFDSFLVMRHGVKTGDPAKDTQSSSFQAAMNTDIPSNHLGCYFCNDIVAPGNSTLDRTLDQQCTVSRPGLSMIASALSVELMVTLLQHPLKYQVHCNTNMSNDFIGGSSDSCLGMVPHQIRGYLHSYSLILPASQAFDKCTACSSHVIQLYQREGFEFLLRAFNDSAYLEDITGLSQLKVALDESHVDLVTELSDSESDDSTRPSAAN